MSTRGPSRDLANRQGARLARNEKIGILSNNFSLDSIPYLTLRFLCYVYNVLQNYARFPAKLLKHQVRE